MSGLFWFRFFPNNWIGGTLGMPPDERSAYFDVLCLIYLHGGPIEDNPGELARVCGCSIRMWKSLRENLLKRGKIIVTADDRLSNSRAEREIFEAEKRSKIARKSIEKRWRSNEIKGLGDTIQRSEEEAKASSDLLTSKARAKRKPRSLAPNGASAVGYSKINAEEARRLIREHNDAQAKKQH